jgi:propanol-preferring alcohol dehydrogenase
MPKHRSNELQYPRSPAQVSLWLALRCYNSSNNPGQILVKINWTGLCASDKSLLHDEWAAFGAVMADSACGVAGHEGAGEVVLAHPDVQDMWQPGDRAGVKWVVSTCKRCEFCTNGTDELHCPKQLNSGLTAPGTFQEYVLTDGRYATR